MSPLDTGPATSFNAIAVQAVCGRHADVGHPFDETGARPKCAGSFQG
ncbi:hypothetical protein TRICHSKD4_3863 [Roseibium sp. TrichSKD4]|nr:hypothetical protein TRICHSKD4_3863 [Roseibium sp. TrichSKD4]